MDNFLTKLERGGKNGLKQGKEKGGRNEESIEWSKDAENRGKNKEGENAEGHKGQKV